MPSSVDARTEATADPDRRTPGAIVDGVNAVGARTVRDPLWGNVTLDRAAASIVDAPEFQRLRRVKQLGFAHLVYPGAVHTRFDHSIGSVHTTQKMIDSINLSFELDPAGTIAVSEEEARVIRIAALLHDVTHIPFGHNIEDQDGLFERHDSAYRTGTAVSYPACVIWPVSGCSTHPVTERFQTRESSPKSMSRC